MSPIERADEILAEGERLRDTHSGCHSLPSSVYDLKQLRKAIINNPESASSTLQFMEYGIEHIRKTVGWIKEIQLAVKEGRI